MAEDEILAATPCALQGSFAVHSRVILKDAVARGR
jgi:hypothetical protein